MNWLIFISTLSFTSLNIPEAGDWHFDTNQHSFNISTRPVEGKLEISYCFILNRGNRVNCDDKVAGMLHASETVGCYGPSNILNHWDGTTFKASVCFGDGNVLSWKAEQGVRYIPKSIVFEK